MKPIGIHTKRLKLRNANTAVSLKQQISTLNEGRIGRNMLYNM
jgi:hypothetical protein